MEVGSRNPRKCPESHLFLWIAERPERIRRKAIIQKTRIWPSGFACGPGPPLSWLLERPRASGWSGRLPAATTRLGPPGEKKLSPTTTNLVCDSREFATRSTSPSTGHGRPPSLRAAVHCLRHYRFLTNSTDVSAVRPAAQVHTAPVHGVRRPQPCSA